MNKTLMTLLIAAVILILAFVLITQAGVQAFVIEIALLAWLVAREAAR